MMGDKYIPSSEIKHPNGSHSDPLGFVFQWNGHLLRGILPESVEVAKDYFDSGFVAEICEKGLFPKTWISDYWNEEFGLIIEHELISPNIYSTDWSFSMLRDAAVLVLEIAKVAAKYGYNMLDCHKLNVMFKNGHPIYVDLGSFIRVKSGVTAWRPYNSFLSAYYHILKLWHSGAGFYAKRLMTPGIEGAGRDYWLYMNPFWRFFPRLLDLKLSIADKSHRLAATDLDNVNTKVATSAVLKKCLFRFAKCVTNKIKPLRAQRQSALVRLQKRISKMSITKYNISEFPATYIGDFAYFVSKHIKGGTSATIFEPKQAVDVSALVNNCGFSSCIVINEQEQNAENVYAGIRKMNLEVTPTYFQLAEGKLLMLRNRFPEQRFKSDIVIIPDYRLEVGTKGVLTLDWIIKERIQYSSQGKLFIGINSICRELIAFLSQKYVIEYKYNNDWTSIYIISQVNECK